jgi:hypothetical protein
MRYAYSHTPCFLRHGQIAENALEIGQNKEQQNSTANVHVYSTYYKV